MRKLLGVARLPFSASGRAGSGAFVLHLNKERSSWLLVVPGWWRPSGGWKLPGFFSSGDWQRADDSDVSAGGWRRARAVCGGRCAGSGARGVGGGIRPWRYTPPAVRAPPTATLTPSSHARARAPRSQSQQSFNLSESKAPTSAGLPAGAGIGDFEAVWKSRPREQKQVRMRGALLKENRFSQAIGRDYTYAGVKNEAWPWAEAPVQRAMLSHINEWLDPTANGCLMNWSEPRRRHALACLPHPPARRPPRRPVAFWGRRTGTCRSTPSAFTATTSGI